MEVQAQPIIDTLPYPIIRGVGDRELKICELNSKIKELYRRGMSAKKRRWVLRHKREIYRLEHPKPAKPKIPFSHKPTTWRVFDFLDPVSQAKAAISCNRMNRASHSFIDRRPGFLQSFVEKYLPTEKWAFVRGDSHTTHLHLRGYNMEWPDRMPRMYLLEHRLYTTLLSFFFSRISTNREYQACDKFLIPYPNNFFQVTRAFVHLPIPHDLCDSFFSRHLPEKTLSGYCRSDFSRELDLDNLENIFLSCHHCDLVPIPGAEAILFQVLEEVLQNVGTGQDFLHFQRIVSDFRLQLDGLIAFSDNLPDHILFYLIDCILMDFSINRASDLLNLKLILFLKEKVVSRPQRWKFFDIKIILILLYEVDLTEAPDDFFDALCEIVMTLYVAELEIKDVKQLISVLPLKKRLGFIFSELDKQRPCWGEHCPKLAATLLENVLKVIEEDLHPFDDILPGMLTMFSFTGTAIKSYRAFKAFPEYLNFCSIHPRYTFGPNQCLKCLALANREQRLLIFEALVYHIKVHKTYQNTKLAERYLQEVIDGTELSVEEEMFICEKRKELKI